MFKSTGILRYDPPRGDMKRNVRNWLVLETCHGIVLYYGDYVRRNPTFWGESRIDLKMPSWGSHVSVVRGEHIRQDFYDRHWRKYEGEVVEFEYSHLVRRSGDTTPGERPENFWFLDVHCDRLMDIRRELGLRTSSPIDGRPFTSHLTIGRVYDE